MDSEQNMPEVPMHQGPPPAAEMQDGSQGSSTPHGMGQSKSSRRRRRKRKNKETVAGPAGQFVGEIQGGAAPAVMQQQPQQSFGGQQGNQTGGGQQQGPATKRWKKKFRERPRGGENYGNQPGGSSNGGSNVASFHREKDSHQPGNIASGFGGKRKGGGGKQQRGPRSFVGPMDHSYREVNGNFSSPPSTIETKGGFSRGGRSYVSDSQPVDYSQGRTIPIPDDAPTKIYFFVEDLFINAKINETARKLGVKVAFVKNDKDAVAELTSHEDEAGRPGLIVFDLNNANAKPLTLIPKLKTKLKKTASIIGFLSHLQGDLKAKAVEAGCDTVMPRAAFSQNLPNLLRRYGLHEEEEESNFNQ